MNNSSNHPKKRAVLLLAHGTPGTAEDVPAYMRNVTSGRPIPEAVMEEVKHRYGLIGKSPLTEITLEQADALRRKIRVPVYVGMRNWHPYVSDATRQMAQDGVQEIVAICLAPQNSRTSVGLYKRAAYAEAGEKIRIEFVESWHNHPLLVAAFAEKLDEAWRKSPLGTKVVFTAHSVPERTIDSGDPYAEQARETAALVAQMAGLTEKDYAFAFQSQGMSGGPWIGPTAEETLQGLRASGVRDVLIQPVGFVCDHVEVLYDIDIAFRKLCGELGLGLRRTDSLNTSDTFIRALAELAKEGLAALEKSQLIDQAVD